MWQLHTLHTRGRSVLTLHTACPRALDLLAMSKNLHTNSLKSRLVRCAQEA